MNITDSPVATMQGEQLNGVIVFKRETLKVVAKEGDSGPIFTCSGGDDPPMPTALWGGQNGGVAFPSGVAQIQRTRIHISALVWRRVIRLTDSGNYILAIQQTVWGPVQSA